MATRTLAFITSCLVSSALAVAGCNTVDFPQRPSPVATSEVTTLEGSRYEGTVLLLTGATSSFNMTLIARGLGATSGLLARSRQTPGTVNVDGSFETGSGIRGTVQGPLDGTLENGNFHGTLSVESAGCTEVRNYSGPISNGGVAWLPGEHVHTCPTNVLTFSIQLARSSGPTCNFAITAPSLPVSGNGGSVTVAIATDAQCSWAAETQSPWITISGPATGSGPGAVTFIVQAATDAARDGSLRIAGQTVSVAQGAPCRYSIAPTTATVPSTGGTRTATVTAPAGCEWSASSTANWITLSATGGSGNATITFIAQVNDGLERQAPVSIAGQTLTVTQQAAPTPTPTPQPPAPGWTYSVSPATGSFDATGGAGDLHITSAADCPWSVVVDVPWIALTSPSSGSGTATLSYTLQPNTGGARTGTLRVGSHVLTVTQTEAPCTYTITSEGWSSIAVEGGNVSVSIATSAHCGWSIQSFTDWITVTGAAGFTGPATATFRVAPNPEATPRPGLLRVAGEMHTITQSICTYNLTATTATFTPSGGPGSLTISAPAGCGWNAQSTVPWIVLTTPVGPHAGSGTIAYQVLPNIGTATLTGTIQITGGTGVVTLTVTQAACTYAIVPTSASYPSSASSGSVNVTATAGCGWSVLSEVPWIVVTPAGGTGNGTFAYRVEANSAPSSRSGTVRLVGGATTRIFTVNQAAPQVTVNVNVSGLAGTVRTPSALNLPEQWACGHPAGVTTMCQITVPLGTQIGFRGLPGAGAVFSNWDGCAPVTGDRTACVVNATVVQTYNVYASFVLPGPG